MKTKIREDIKELVFKIIGDEIYYIHANKTPKDTYLEYMFYKTSKDNFSAGKSNTKTHYIQIDIYSNKSTTTIEETLEKGLEKKGYFLNDSYDGYEQETKLYTRKMRFNYTESLKR